MEGEFIKKFRIRRSRIWISKGIFVRVKKEFDEEDEELVKVAELKKIEKGERIMEDFVQEFRKVARESGYKERVLVKEF